MTSSRQQKQGVSESERCVGFFRSFELNFLLAVVLSFLGFGFLFVLFLDGVALFIGDITGVIDLWRVVFGIVVGAVFWVCLFFGLFWCFNYLGGAEL